MIIGGIIMKSVLIGNGVNIQFGGKAYTSEFILQRIKYKAKQDKYSDLFEKSISGNEIVDLLNGFVDICNDILKGQYDDLIEKTDDLVALQDFKKRYEKWTVTESKDIMLEDWFFLIHMFFLKNPDLSDNETGAIQAFERLCLDSIYNEGDVEQIYKLTNKKYKRFLNSFDNLFTVNYDNNIEKITGREVFHLHGDFSVLNDSENPNIVSGFLRTEKKQTVAIPGYEHCFCNALLNYSGYLKYKRAQSNHELNLVSQTYTENIKTNPDFYAPILETHPEMYEIIMTKIKHPELQMATEYYFDKLATIKSEIHIIGLSPNNDSHIFNIINKNNEIHTVYFYYFSPEEKKQAETVFKTKNLICIQVINFWKTLDCSQKKYNCNYKFDYSAINLVEICKLFSGYGIVTKETLQKEINTIPLFEMHRLTKVVKDAMINQGRPGSEKQLQRFMDEISFIGLRGQSRILCKQHIGCKIES